MFKKEIKLKKKSLHYVLPSHHEEHVHVLPQIICLVTEEIKKSRTYQHGTHKIKGHKSTKYKDLQRFKTQRTQTQTQPSISSKPRISHEKSKPFVQISNPETNP